MTTTAEAYPFADASDPPTCVFMGHRYGSVTRDMRTKTRLVRCSVCDWEGRLDDYDERSLDQFLSAHRYEGNDWIHWMRATTRGLLS